MKLPTITGARPFEGEVIEILEKDGSRNAVVALKYTQIEIPMDILGDAHLGDRLILRADIVLKDIITGTC